MRTLLQQFHVLILYQFTSLPFILLFNLHLHLYIYVYNYIYNCLYFMCNHHLIIFYFLYTALRLRDLENWDLAAWYSLIEPDFLVEKYVCMKVRRAQACVVLCSVVLYVLNYVCYFVCVCVCVFINLFVEYIMCVFIYCICVVLVCQFVSLLVCFSTPIQF